MLRPAWRWFSRARASISSVMSRPYAFPDGPTRLAESSTSMPPPEPRSRTTSPGLSAASAVGFPQPSAASTASAGSPSVCFRSYRLTVIGSTAPGTEQQLDLQPQEVLPSVTRSAAFPYFSFTTSLMSAMIALLAFGSALNTACRTS